MQDLFKGGLKLRILLILPDYLLFCPDFSVNSP